MKRNRLFVIFGVILTLLALGLAAMFVIKNFRGPTRQTLAEINLCKEDAKGLCIVSFVPITLGL